MLIILHPPIINMILLLLLLLLSRGYRVLWLSKLIIVAIISLLLIAIISIMSSTLINNLLVSILLRRTCVLFFYGFSCIRGGIALKHFLSILSQCHLSLLSTLEIWVYIILLILRVRVGRTTFIGVIWSYKYYRCEVGIHHYLIKRGLFLLVLIVRNLFSLGKRWIFRRLSLLCRQLNKQLLIMRLHSLCFFVIWAILYSRLLLPHIIFLDFWFILITLMLILLLCFALLFSLWCLIYLYQWRELLRLFLHRLVSKFTYIFLHMLYLVFLLAACTLLLMYTSYLSILLVWLCWTIKRASELCHLKFLTTP